MGWRHLGTPWVLITGVILLLLFGGCLGDDGLLDNDDPDGDGIPHWKHEAPRPGFLEDGEIASGGELFDATARVVANRSHELEYRRSTLVADSDGNFSDGRFVELEREIDREGDVRAAREVVDAEGATVVESETRYYRDGNASSFWIYRNGSSVDERPLRAAPSLVNASPIPFRGRVRIVTVTGIERMRHISTTNAFRVDLDLLPEDSEVGYSGSAVIGTDGVVYELGLEESRAARGRQEIRWELRDVDTTTVDVPSWLHGNRSSANASLQR